MREEFSVKIPLECIQSETIQAKNMVRKLPSGVAIEILAFGTLTRSQIFVVIRGAQLQIVMKRSSRLTAARDAGWSSGAQAKFALRTILGLAIGRP